VLNPKDPEKEGTIKFQSEILFYRYSGNSTPRRPGEQQTASDLVVCLHLNAEGWAIRQIQLWLIPITCTCS